jgi:hypothetical protein
MSQSTLNDDRAGLSLLEAARRLNISEKTLRRRIKADEVKAEKVSLDGGGLEWRVYLDEAMTVPDIVPEVVPDKKARAGTDNDRAGSETVNTTDVPDIVPEHSETRAGTVADTSQSTLVEHLLDENKFLRSQIEAHARSEAELRAALREALKGANRALPEPTTDATHETETPTQSTLEPQPDQTELLQQIETLQANQDSQRHEMEWMAQQMKTPPSPAKRGLWARWFGSD